MEEKASLYVESSIFSYYLNKTSKDITIASRQLMAIEWWDDYRNRYKLFISEAVLQDISKGEPKEVKKRADFIEDHKKEFAFLKITKEVLELASLYFHELCLPEDAREDGVHLALTVVYQMDYLLTWNLSHFARHERKEEIRRLNLKLKKYHPNIVTPQDLIKEE